MKAGDTFLETKAGGHLWAVISDPDWDPANLVVVMFVTWKKHCDQDCILDKGDHPFIHHKTCVEYSSSEIVSSAAIDQELRDGNVKKHSPLPAATLTRIRTAAATADMRNDCRRVLQSQFLV